MSKRLSHLAGVALLSIVFIQPPHASTPQSMPLQVIKQAGTVIQISWQMPDLKIFPAGGTGSSHMSFAGSDISYDYGDFALPYKRFSLGIPSEARVSYEISDIVYETINNITLAEPVMPGRDQNGISISVTRSQNEVISFPDQPLIDVSEQVFFRDLPLVHVSFYPLRYNAGSRQVRVIKSATLTFKFSDGRVASHGLSGRSKIDHLYQKIVLNFDQAQQWLTGRVPALRKPAAAFDGPWFRFEISKEGLYKINATTLSAAGIDPGSVDPRTLKIYNHGGFPLETDTRRLVENPEGPLETAIIVSGEEDGRFDSADFILFYGKGIGGWAYNSSVNQFKFSQHPYDKKNYYWLTYGGAPGKRMQSETAPAAGATVTETYFIERAHFEEDKYNLLASGTDWYGYRFFGKTHEVSINYTLNNISATPQQASLAVQFKGGSGLRYRDDDPYRYYFSGWINPAKAPSALFSSEQLREEQSMLIERDFTSLQNLQEGTNTFYIQYTGNLENCNAYLDWVEFYYPRDFTAVNNQLIFYTHTTGQIVHYSVGGFSGQDILLFDISDPKDVRQVIHNSALQNGRIDFNLDLRDAAHRRLLVSSGQSAEISQVGSLTAYQPDLNLMDQSLSADLLIISPPSFRSYAEEIADLRAQGTHPLSAKVINLNDIYFYFGSGVKDPVAIRNFIRYAYYNWSGARPAYVLLFGDGHYDYRNLALPDTNRVPPFEISANLEIDSRESDNFYVDINFSSTGFGSIQPDLAVGRMPAESALDARRMVDKLKAYGANPERDGWQTSMTFVADDEMTSSSSSEWFHQSQTETMAELNELNKFIKRKIYLTAYESIPGGFGRVKPEANQAIIDQLNEGTLLINYAGHGSPTAWAHESALSMSRDLKRIQNEGRLPLWIAATCDFGKYDDPHDPSFTEALVWEEDRGAIAVVSSSRLVYAFDNSRFNTSFLRNLFSAGASRRLGEAMLLSTLSIINDQKYHLFGDPSMFLADPRGHIQITSISPDTLKALSKVMISGTVHEEDTQVRSESFTGGAFLMVNDALYDSVNTGGPGYYTQFGPRIFKGEISVENGLFSGEFIVPKSIRYHDRASGRVTIFAWNEEGEGDAIGYADTLLFMGSSSDISDAEGPEIKLFFDGQEDFRDGDMVKKNTVLIARLFDDNGINLTQEVGHKIEITIDDQQARDITSFFAYDRNSYAGGQLAYHLDDQSSGRHHLKLQAWDNLNNPTVSEIDFNVVDEEGLVLQNVVNYPNPFSDQTNFTFQLLGTSLDTEIKIKIYTITGRLIKTFDYLAPPVDGFNYYPWDGRDDDGDNIANGVYLYKVIVKNTDQQLEMIEKLVVLR